VNSLLKLRPVPMRILPPDVVNLYVAGNLASASPIDFISCSEVFEAICPSAAAQRTVRVARLVN
jgi:hypothetical protein